MLVIEQGGSCLLLFGQGGVSLVASGGQLMLHCGVKALGSSIGQKNTQPSLNNMLTGQQSSKRKTVPGLELQAMALDTQKEKRERSSPV